jgi:phosphopantothenoylcysteine decarboxylase/phosphopantothenate--cysteine ligase
MRVLVTAGGTREAVDDVRVIANTSTGRLGARIADAAEAAGHEVLLLHGTVAARPASARVRREAFESSADLARLLQRHAPGSDAVLHAAAVSDFVPQRAPGKLDSGLPEITLRLVRAPKLIDGLRALAPEALLVGYKLTARAVEEEMLAAARALLQRARLDAVVVNDAGRTGEEDHEALLVSADEILARCRGKERIAQALVALLAGRAGAATT